MENLGRFLMEEMNVMSVFSIGGADMARYLAATWVMMAAGVIVCVLLTRNLKVERPGRGQLMLEYVVTGLQGIGKAIVGEEGERYASYPASALLYLGIANLVGILGFKPPTSSRKGSGVMENLGEFLVEEMNCESVFSIGGIEVAESVVVTWIIMAAVVFAAVLLTRKLKVEHPGRGQLMLEFAVTGLQGIGKGIVGEEGERYASYLSSVLLYLGIANLIGILGFKPPTKDLNVTAALAIMSIILIEGAGIRAKGIKRWLKGFTEPVPLVTPINVLEVLIKPLSLCMRLFGNVLGAFVVMKLIEHVLPVGLPVVFGIYFDWFDGLIQAYVFVFLTGLFIKEAIE